MANNFAADFQEIWAREQQLLFFRKNVSLEIADTSFDSQLSYADTLNRPFRSTTLPQTYTRGSAITIDDLTDTQEQLTINNQFATGFYIDDFDKIQSVYDLAAAYGKDKAIQLSNQVDASVLGEVSNATNTVDDGDIGGTSGNGIALTTSNVLATFSAAKRALAKQNVDMENLFAVVSPDMEDILVQYGAGRDTQMGDTGNMNGFFGKFYGFDLHRSNQTTGSALLAMATQPADGDTVVIQGVTFTFKTVLGSDAGNVLIGASADAARANLTALINAPGTTTAQGVALSTQNARLFVNASAVNDNAANTMTLTFKGVGVLTVSETFTDATDTWTVAKQKQNLMFGVKKKTPVLVVQRKPLVQVKEVQDKLGKNILNGLLYGVKTFTDNAKMMVNVQIQSSTFSAPATS